MHEYIDREKIIKKLNDDIDRCYMLGVDGVGLITDLIDTIKKQHTADVQEVKHGHWIEQKNSVDLRISCSVCGYCYTEADTSSEERFNFCPSCGAKMDEDAEE